MSRKVKRLTSSRLKKMILEEAAKLRVETLEQGKEDSEKVDAVETDADELAGSLEKDIDYIKALKIHEQNLIKKVKKIREAKSILRKRIAKNI